MRTDTFSFFTWHAVLSRLIITCVRLWISSTCPQNSCLSMASKPYLQPCYCLDLSHLEIRQMGTVLFSEIGITNTSKHTNMLTQCNIWEAMPEYMLWFVGNRLNDYQSELTGRRPSSDLILTLLFQNHRNLAVPLYWVHLLSLLYLLQYPDGKKKR
jgi:hypothetical protein